MPYENISATLDPAVAADIQNKITEIKDLLPFLVNLTVEERSTMLKMGDKSVAFVEKSLEYGLNNSNLAPPYVDIPELEKDFNLARTLAPINAQLNSLAEQLDDTTMAVGSEAFYMALGFYSSVKQATKMNVPGTDSIYNDLKQRFPGATPATPEPEPGD